jgi:hypothetical protein
LAEVNSLFTVAANQTGCSYNHLPLKRKSCALMHRVRCDLIVARSATLAEQSTSLLILAADAFLPVHVRAGAAIAPARRGLAFAISRLMRPV